MSGATITVQDAPQGVAVSGLDLSQQAIEDALRLIDSDAVVTGPAIALVAVHMGGLVDVLASPSTMLVRDASGELVARWPTDRFQDRDAPIVGRYSTASALDLLNPDESGISAAERDRRLWVLALRRQLRTLPTWAVPSGSSERPAAGWPLVLAVAARVIIALGVVEIVARHLDHVAEVVIERPIRQREALYARAGADYETRVRSHLAHPEQEMAPPSEAEQAIRPTVEADGRAEWAEVLKETASNLGTVAAIVAGVWLIGSLFGGK